jgi:hypothetical protein
MWKPIDTAPRDGSRINARDSDGCIFYCRWWSREHLANWDGASKPEEWEQGWYDYIGENGEDGETEVFPEFWFDERD